MKHSALMTLGAALILAGAGAGEVRAQTDLNAGKSAAQMFASNCTACHRSPAGLARGRNPRSLAYFLAEHYTARPENAGAIAGYLLSVRGSAPPQRASNPTAPGAPAAPSTAAATPPAARQRPLDKIAHSTVERLKTFASAADAAVPSDPNAPPRGVKQLQAYATAGTAPAQLRQTAVNAALRQAPANLPAQDTASPGGGAAANDAAPAGSTTATIGPAADASENGAVLQLRGPPASGAKPSRQSNNDQF